jgi:hypothetical protein
MGAIGIWPLSNRCGRLLKSARLKESQLMGRMMRGYMESPARFWYVSGIVSFEELGAATDWAPGRTMDDSDIVLRRILS